MRLVLPARGRHADRAPRRARLVRRGDRPAHRVALHPGALRGAELPSRACSAWRRSMCGSSRPRSAAASASKGHVYPEDILVPAVARRLGQSSQVDRDAARALPYRGGRPRSGAPRAPGRLERRHHRRPRDGVHAGSRRAHDARRGHHLQHHQPPRRPLSRAPLSRRGTQRRHAQDLHRRLSRRGAARSQFRPRSPARPRRACGSAWTRPICGARTSFASKICRGGRGSTYRDGVPIAYDPVTT